MHKEQPIQQSIFLASINHPVLVHETPRRPWSPRLRHGRELSQNPTQIHAPPLGLVNAAQPPGEVWVLEPHSAHLTAVAGFSA